VTITHYPGCPFTYRYLDIMSNEYEDSRSELFADFMGDNNIEHDQFMDYVKEKYINPQKMKSKLLDDQANEISCHFQSIIQDLEDQLYDEMEKNQHNPNYQMTAFTKKVLMQIIKIFNEFLCIESVFKIDCETLRLELEHFLLKDQFYYSVDLLLSLNEGSEVMIIMDPYMPNEVEGDLLKFRQIITSVLSFALKISKKIHLKSNVQSSVESNEVYIQFGFTFKPDFDIDINSLKILFSNEENSMLKQTKMNYQVGLCIHIVSNLVKVMKGKFTEIEKRDNGELFINFTLPFERVESSKHKTLRREIRLNSDRHDKNGGMCMKSPVAEPNNFKKSNQQLGKVISKSSLSNYVSRSNLDDKKWKDSSTSVKDFKDVSKVRNSIRSIEAPKTTSEPRPEKPSMTQEEIEEAEIQEMIQKEMNDRKELNSTIVPSQSKFPIVKKEPAKNQNPPSFPNQEKQDIPINPLDEMPEESTRLAPSSLVSRIEAESEATKDLAPITLNIPKESDSPCQLEKAGSKFSFEGGASDEETNKHQKQEEKEDPKSGKKHKKKSKKEKKDKKEKKEKKAKKAKDSPKKKSKLSPDSLENKQSKNYVLSPQMDSSKATPNARMDFEGSFEEKKGKNSERYEVNNL